VFFSLGRTLMAARPPGSFVYRSGLMGDDPFPDWPKPICFYLFL